MATPHLVTLTAPERSHYSFITMPDDYPTVDWMNAPHITDQSVVQANEHGLFICTQCSYTISMQDFSNSMAVMHCNYPQKGMLTCGACYDKAEDEKKMRITEKNRKAKDDKKEAEKKVRETEEKLRLDYEKKLAAPAACSVPTTYYAGAGQMSDQEAELLNNLNKMKAMKKKKQQVEYTTEVYANQLKYKHRFLDPKYRNWKPKENESTATALESKQSDDDNESTATALESKQSDDDDEEGDYAYGAHQFISTELIMAGGSAQWWNYIVECDKDGKQKHVFIVNRTGRHLQDGLLYFNNENRDRVQVLYEPKDGWTEFCMYL